MKSEVVFWQKSRVQEHFVLELKIHEITRSNQYPDGVRYGLICKDMRSERQVLMDNHHPKGHHLHLDEKEMPYEFKGVAVLLQDFMKLVKSHLGVKL